MNSEALRIADQLTRAFSGDAWHGPPLRELLTAVKAVSASARPIPGVHSIWELVVHIDLYVAAADNATREIPMPRWFGTGQDWPPLTDVSEQAWRQATNSLFRHAEKLAASIRGLPDSFLLDTVPGRDYNFYHLFHGIVQHSLYHGGQIAILKKAVDS
jgi:hypothetical protein